MFVCEYCDKEFKRQHAFEGHKCAARERDEILKTIDGMAAHDFYNEWMSAQGRRKYDKNIFVSSRFFVTFVKFAKYVRDIRLTRPKEFIKFMVQSKIQPTIWTSTHCYDMYMMHLKNTVAPVDQAAITVDTLFSLADLAEDNVAAVFNMLYPQELLGLIVAHKLSPWVLLCSTVFKHKVAVMAPDEQKELLEVINPAYWESKFKSDPSSVAYMRTIVKELGI